MKQHNITKINYTSLRHLRIYSFVVALFIIGYAVPASAESARTLVKEGNKLYSTKDSSRRAEALEKYLEARDRRKNRFEIPFNIGTTYDALGRTSEAQSWLEEAARSKDVKVRGDAQYQLGNMFYRQQKWDDAIKSYVEALRSNPSDTAARHNLELAYWKKHMPPPPDSSNQNQNNKEDKKQQDSTKQQQQQQQRDKMLEKARDREAEVQKKLMQRRNQGEPGEAPSGKDW